MKSPAPPDAESARKSGAGGSLTRAERILASSSFSLLALAAVLIWTAWKHRIDGASLKNVVLAVGAVLAISLSVQGTRLRHRMMRQSFDLARPESPPPTKQRQQRGKR